MRLSSRKSIAIMQELLSAHYQDLTHAEAGQILNGMLSR